MRSRFASGVLTFAAVLIPQQYFQHCTAFHRAPFINNRSITRSLNQQQQHMNSIFQSIRSASSSNSNSGSSLHAKITAAADVLKDPKWPEQWPFRPEDFSRQDESSDSGFYSQPRFVYHIDEGAVKALTNYYQSILFEGADVLDICSSWVSHLPTGDSAVKLGRVAGVGMVAAELQKNPQLTESAVADLNVDPRLPYPDNSFDFVTCVVSVDYLTRPLEVFSEIRRVLKPGGRAVISQSNRCFPTKAIDIWLRTNDLEHIFIIGAYFHYATGFEKAESIDISPKAGLFGASDPMYIIQARKA